LFHLPAYARKLNPIKGVWAHMKKSLANPPMRTRTN
jgi:transposase